MAAKNASAPLTERLLPDETRNGIITNILAIDKQTPELPIKMLAPGKKTKGMGQASYGFASEMSLIIQTFPDLLSTTFETTVASKLQNIDDVDQVLAHLVKLTQRYLNARQVLGSETMEMSNDAYANLKRRAVNRADYNMAYQKVKVFYEKSKKEQQQTITGAKKDAALDIAGDAPNLPN